MKNNHVKYFEAEKEKEHEGCGEMGEDDPMYYSMAVMISCMCI